MNIIIKYLLKKAFLVCMKSNKLFFIVSLDLKELNIESMLHPILFLHG